MREWDFETSAAQLRDAIEELQITWQETAEVWSDPVSERFLREHLEPIAPAMKLTLDAVGRVNQMLTKIYHDCES